jgi:nucleotide-binding universal stress UspA family protein
MVERRSLVNAKKETKGFSILLADDGSEHARAAVSLLADLKLPRDSHIRVLRVLTPLQAGERVAIESALEATRKQMLENGFDADGELLMGYPAEKIIEYAEEHKPDLILLGAKGLRSTLGILLGGVAQQIVEYASCPVLIVRAPYNGFSRILLATDGSESSMAAVSYLGNFPIPVQARIEVMHVLPPPSLPISVVEPMFMDLGPSETGEISEAESARRKKEEEEGQILVTTCCDLLKQHGKEASFILRRGDAATEIIEYAKNKKINLIVTGSRGLSQVRSWLMGSVSRKLVHYSGCSILVVRNYEE